MIFGLIILSTALTLSGVAAYYSIAGLVAIFSAAPIPIMIMGGSLEIGKIVSTVFLHNNWKRLELAYKAYLIPAVMILMLLTSLGIFGLLSKAHLDQSIVSGDSMSKVAIYDEKIKTEKDNIDSAKKAIGQMNSQVDQMMSRTDSDKGAERAVIIRKQQAKERKSLQDDITKSQKNIIQLQEERAPLAAENRKIEAEVGPIKYIAALIYGDNPDQNILEKAVRWVIILIVVVFDPLALCLILAANKQLEWAREGKGGWVHEDEDAKPLDLTPAPDLEEVPPSEQVAEALHEPLTVDNSNSAYNTLPESYLFSWTPHDPIYVADMPTPTPTAIVEENIIEPLVAKDAESSYNLDVEESLTQTEFNFDQPIQEESVAIIPEPESTIVVEEQVKLDDPNLPVLRGDYAVRYQGKVYNLDAFNSMHPELALRADNDVPPTESKCGFGISFPLTPSKGDMFIRVDYMPEHLYKWNGEKWIEIDKNSTDSYAYNAAYIQHLVSKLQAGEYEIEDLSDTERDQVEQQIEDIVRSKNA